jgi:3-hydroxybutyryl-CoA dehydratase
MKINVNISELAVSSKLPEIEKLIVQEDINLYAKASQDFNPIHINPEFAKNTAHGGTIAHGMFVLAHISQMMTDSFGLFWLTTGKLNVRFKAAARPGDIIKVQGTIKKIQTDETQKTINCEVLCSNQKGDTVITGDAIVKIKND